MTVYQSHNVSLFLSFRVRIVLQSASHRRTKWQYTSLIMFLYFFHQGSDSVTECITEENKVAVYQSHNVSFFLSSRVPTVLQSASQRRIKWQYTSLIMFLYFFHLGFRQCYRVYHRGEQSCSIPVS